MPRASRNFLETPHPARQQRGPGPACEQPQQGLPGPRGGAEGLAPPSPGAADISKGKSQMPGAPGTDLPPPGLAEGAAGRTSASRAPPVLPDPPAPESGPHFPSPSPASGPGPEPTCLGVTFKEKFLFLPTARRALPPAGGLAASPRARGHLGQGSGRGRAHPRGPGPGLPTGAWARPGAPGAALGCRGLCQGVWGYPARSRAGPADAGPTAARLQAPARPPRTLLAAAASDITLRRPFSLSLRLQMLWARRPFCAAEARARPDPPAPPPPPPTAACTGCHTRVPARPCQLRPRAHRCGSALTRPSGWHPGCEKQG